MHFWRIIVFGSVGSTTGGTTTTSADNDASNGGDGDGGGHLTISPSFSSKSLSLLNSRTIFPLTFFFCCCCHHCQPTPPPPPTYSTTGRRLFASLSLSLSAFKCPQRALTSFTDGILSCSHARARSSLVFSFFLFCWFLLAEISFSQELIFLKWSSSVSTFFLLWFVELLVEITTCWRLYGRPRLLSVLSFLYDFDYCPPLILLRVFLFLSKFLAAFSFLC